MESFAFWYEKKDAEDSQEELSAVMNFNLWHECGWGTKRCRFGRTRKNKYPYLDIGFKLRNLHLAQKLYFFLPFQLSEDEKAEHLVDLGEKFNKTELVDAIFNESYTTTIAANRKVIRVEDSIGQKFDIYQLDMIHDVHLEPFADGTIMQIPTHNIRASGREEQGEYYLRFRIQGKPLPFLIHEYKTPSMAFQSIFNTTHMIDFRYHNIRSLHKSLIERFSQGKNRIVRVSAVHFLLVTKAFIDVVGKDFKSTRKLEQGVWKDYVEGNDTEDLVAYHHVNKAGPEEEYIPSSELFIKYKVERSLLLPYLLFTIALGACGSALWSALWSIVLQPLFGL